MMKRILVTLVILSIAMMTSCNLATPADTGSSVEVVMGGTEGARGYSFAESAAWVKINVVVASSGVQKGSGVLSKTAGVWKGSIHVSESGTMRFIATAGLDEEKVQVDWIGNSTLVMGSSGILTITVGTPTSDGSGYGPAGGKVFYDKGSYSFGWRYLEAASSNQSTAIGWSSISDVAVGPTAQGTGFGTGQANTTAIVGQGCSSGAAYLCDALTLGGYDDWFLPSKVELNEMYGKRVAIGGFTSDWYWSSSEFNNFNAWLHSFINGNQLNNNKFGNLYVRAVRAF